MAGTRHPLRAARFLRSVGVFALGAYPADARRAVPTISRSYWPDIVYLSRQHLEAGRDLRRASPIAIGVPLGILLTRQAVRPYANAITQFVNLGTTIPTLAILALAMTLLGIGAPSGDLRARRC